MKLYDAFYSHCHYVSGHTFIVSDSKGQTVDLIPFCSDRCHQQWCQDSGSTYMGWNGCQEIAAPTSCANCNAVMK